MRAGAPSKLLDMSWMAAPMMHSAIKRVRYIAQKRDLTASYALPGSSL